MDKMARKFPGGCITGDSDEEDLEALRLAALQSLKQKRTEKVPGVYFPSHEHSCSTQKGHGWQDPNTLHNTSTIFKPHFDNCNLIAIVPVGREKQTSFRKKYGRGHGQRNYIHPRNETSARPAVGNSQVNQSTVINSSVSKTFPKLVRPQDRYHNTSEEKVPSPEKPKDKFSRYDSDSNSEDEDESEVQVSKDKGNESASEEDALNSKDCDEDKSEEKEEVASSFTSSSSEEEEEALLLNLDEDSFDEFLNVFEQELKDDEENNKPKPVKKKQKKSKKKSNKVKHPEECKEKKSDSVKKENDIEKCKLAKAKSTSFQLDAAETVIDKQEKNSCSVDDTVSTSTENLVPKLNAYNEETGTNSEKVVLSSISKLPPGQVDTSPPKSLQLGSFLQKSHTQPLQISASVERPEIGRSSHGSSYSTSRTQKFPQASENIHKSPRRSPFRSAPATRNQSKSPVSNNFPHRTPPHTRSSHSISPPCRSPCRSPLSARSSRRSPLLVRSPRRSPLPFRSPVRSPHKSLSDRSPVRSPHRSLLNRSPSRSPPLRRSPQPVRSSSRSSPNRPHRSLYARSPHRSLPPQSPRRSSQTSGSPHRLPRMVRSPGRSSPPPVNLTSRSPQRFSGSPVPYQDTVVKEPRNPVPYRSPDEAGYVLQPRRISCSPTPRYRYRSPISRRYSLSPLPRRYSRSPSRCSLSPRRSRSPRYSPRPRSFSRSPRRSPFSPLSPRGMRSPRSYSRSPVSRSRSFSRSPRRLSSSPRRVLRSPRKYSQSPPPRHLSHSPRRYSHSPKRYSHSPKRYSHSPKRYSRSPKRYSLYPRQHSNSPRRYSRSPRRYSISPHRYSPSSLSYSSRTPSLSPSPERTNPNDPNSRPARPKSPLKVPPFRHRQDFSRRLSTPGCGPSHRKTESRESPKRTQQLSPGSFTVNEDMGPGRKEETVVLHQTKSTVDMLPVEGNSSGSPIQEKVNHQVLEPQTSDEPSCLAQQESNKNVEEEKQKPTAEQRNKEEEEGKVRNDEYQETLNKLPAPERERLEARKRKFETNQPIVPSDNKKVISLKGIVDKNTIDCERRKRKKQKLRTNDIVVKPETEVSSSVIKGEEVNSLLSEGKNNNVSVKEREEISNLLVKDETDSNLVREGEGVNNAVTETEDIDVIHDSDFELTALQNMLSESESSDSENESRFKSYSTRSQPGYHTKRNTLSFRHLPASVQSDGVKKSDIKIPECRRVYHYHRGEEWRNTRGETGYKKGDRKHFGKEKDRRKEEEWEGKPKETSDNTQVVASVSEETDGESRNKRKTLMETDLRVELSRKRAERTGQVLPKENDESSAQNVGIVRSVLRGVVGHQRERRSSTKRKAESRAEEYSQPKRMTTVKEGKDSRRVLVLRRNKEDSQDNAENSPIISITIPEEDMEKSKDAKSKVSVHMRLGSLQKSKGSKGLRKNISAKRSDSQDVAVSSHRFQGDDIPSHSPQTRKEVALDSEHRSRKKGGPIYKHMPVEELDKKRNRNRLKRNVMIERRRKDGEKNSELSDGVNDDSELELRIRRIQEKNAEIMKRKMEIEADKQKYG